MAAYSVKYNKNTFDFAVALKHVNFCTVVIQVTDAFFVHPTNRHFSKSNKNVRSYNYMPLMLAIISQ